MKAYQPIACDLVDIIEHYATLRVPVHVAYLDAGSLKRIETIIVDWYNRAGVEFLVTTDLVQHIRLDNIIRIADTGFQRYC